TACNSCKGAAPTSLVGSGGDRGSGARNACDSARGCAGSETGGGASSVVPVTDAVTASRGAWRSCDLPAGCGGTAEVARRSDTTRTACSAETTVVTPASKPSPSHFTTKPLANWLPPPTLEEAPACTAAAVAAAPTLSAHRARSAAPGAE